MSGLIFLVVLISVILGAIAGGFWTYRRGLRFAKSIERGIKMVPILISLPPPSDDAEVGGRDVRDVIQERISQAEVLYSLIASTATKGFKSRFFGQRHIAFEIVAVDGMIRFYAAVPVALVAVIKQAILTAYPGAQLDEVEDHNIFSPQGKISGTYGGEVNLKHRFSYPIATFNQLKRDAMQAMINALTNLEAGDGASIQIMLRPAYEGWVKSSENLVKKKKEGDEKSGLTTKSILQAPFKVPDSSNQEDSNKPPKQLTSLEQSVLDAIEEKTKSAGYEVLIRVISSSSTASRAQAITHNIVSSFSLFDAPGLNGFKFEPAKDIEKFVTHFIFRFFPPEQNSNVLNSVELATLFHFPDYQFTSTTQLQRQYSKQVEGPTRISKEGLLLGYNVYRGVKKDIRLSDEDRRRHIYVVGQTGTGKTVMLQNMMVQDMKAGKGFAFIDPHGDAAEQLLGMVPPERTEDVIYFDPGNFNYPMGLNLFEYKTPEQKDFLIQETINMLEKLYDPHQQGIVGPRYHHMFRNAALTVMADPEGGTFIDIPKLFRDPQFVRQKLKHVQDKTVLEFWQKEIPQAQRSNDFGEVTSWFVSKFGAFLSNEMMRDIIGQSKSAFDLREVMDGKKILIANLSKGRLGELNSMLLGMIFVMKFQAAAMSRASVPEEQRQDFSLYVDEFQNFSTESFGFILSEARKYRLQLIVANQFISQLSDEVKGAVFGNAGTIVSFRIGPDDADYLVKQLAPVFNDRDLVSMPNYNVAIRMMSGGLPTQPFNMATLPPIGTQNPQLADALKQLSAAKYGKPRAEVEEAIFARLATKEAPSPFDSLASSRGQGPAAAGSAPRPGSSAGSSGSSFLDEWLAKRRQTMQSGGQPRPSGGASTGPPAGAARSGQSQTGNQGPTPPAGQANGSKSSAPGSVNPNNPPAQAADRPGSTVSKHTQKFQSPPGGAGANDESYDSFAIPGSSSAGSAKTGRTGSRPDSTGGSGQTMHHEHKSVQPPPPKHFDLNEVMSGDNQAAAAGAASNIKPSSASGSEPSRKPVSDLPKTAAPVPQPQENVLPTKKQPAKEEKASQAANDLSKPEPFSAKASQESNLDSTVTSKPVDKGAPASGSASDKTAGIGKTTAADTGKDRPPAQKQTPASGDKPADSGGSSTPNLKTEEMTTGKVTPSEIIKPSKQPNRNASAAENDSSGNKDNASKDNQVPDLKPGEVYIDDSGEIHRG